MPKRILRAMQIMELSAVDNPAQEGATFVLAKRAAPEDKPTCGCDKPEPEDGKCRKCGKPMGKGLTEPGSGKANSDDDVSKSGEDTMTDAEKAALAKAEADKDAAEKALADEKAASAVLAKVAGLTDVEKAHYEGLKELDEDGAKKFLDMDKDARAAEIEKAKSADPVIYTDSDGHQYHKSEAKAAALAKRADDLAKRNRELEAKDADAAIEKRAVEFKNLKGEMPAKVALLKAVDKIEDETQRAAAIEILKATDAGLGEAMKTLGTKAGPAVTEPEAKLNKLAEDYATAHKISFAKAYDTVVQTKEGEVLYKEMIEAKLPRVAA